MSDMGLDKTLPNNQEIVYRVQDRFGRGPWRPGFSHKWVVHRDDSENLIPWPFEFGPVHTGLMTFEHGGSGCMTLDQLRRWFIPLEWLKLKSYGYHAVKLRVDRILAQSDLQCVFARIRPLNEEIEQIELYPET